MGKRFIDELQELPTTMQWAAEQDVALLRRAVQLYGDRGLLAVGSGGSFTAAAYAADQHFRAFGRPSQAITPLEVFQVPANAAANAAGLLLSAEGKNHDILAAAKQLRPRWFCFGEHMYPMPLSPANCHFWRTGTCSSITASSKLAT